MNTRLNKALSALAATALVASSFVWALPVSAATPGDARWNAQDVPSDVDNVLVNGSSIMDIAVGTDGKTIYVANALSTDYIFKSTDGGKTFDEVMNDYGGSVPVAIAVAPDDVNTAAVADTGSVWITRDGGTTWSELSAPTLGGNGTITDVAVAPSRSGTLLGREYFISIADTTVGVADGDVQTIGVNTNWESVATTGIDGVADFTSIALSPNYVGDRGLVAVGTSATAPGATKVFIINVSSKAIVGTPTALDTASVIVDVGAAADDIISSSIALPSNFDPASGSNSRAYIGINSNVTAENDVYRYTDEAVRRLGADARINSVAFAGTVSSGKLFAGIANAPEVKYSSNPTASDPDWDTNDTSITGDATNPRVIVAVASDYATSNKVFAGSQGSQSAFFVTEDAGVSFYAQSLVNVGASILPSPGLSFTGNMVFLTSTTSGYFNIWKSDVPFTSTSWKRIYAQTGTSGAGFQLKVNPAYATTPALYIVETGVADSKIYVSQDAGVTWSTRFGPSGVTHGASVLRDAQTIYFVTNTGDIYKSTNAAWTWDDVVDTGLSNASSITLPAANQVIVGGNSVAISTDDAETFTLLDNGLDAGTSYSVARDADYANNHLIYAVDTATANDVFRVDASNTDNSWDDMNAPINAQVKGITQRSGVLFVTVASDTDNVIRTLFPAATIGDQYWSTLTAGTAFTPGAGVSTSGSILLYVRGTDSKIYAYNDFLATMKPTLTTPADNFNLAVDPASGYGYATDLKFQPMTSGSTKVDAVDIEIADKTNGLTGNPTATVSVNTNNPFVNTSNNALNFNLQPNHSYVWRVRAASTTTEDEIISPWSDSRTVNVQAGGQVVQQQAGVILQGPQPGASGVNPNLVGFSWAPVPGATEYQIIIAENAALTTTVAGTPAKVTTTSYQATGLKAGTTYFWAVQATAPTTSQQSVGTFVTASAAQSPAPGTPTGPGTQPTIIVQQPAAETPAYIWAVIAIGAILIIAVIILIVRTRRVP